MTTEKPNPKQPRSGRADAVWHACIARVESIPGSMIERERTILAKIAERAAAPGYHGQGAKLSSSSSTQGMGGVI